MDNSQIKDNVEKAYDNIADTYLSWTENTFASRLSYLTRLLALLPTPSDEKPISILELGCGAGVPVTQTLASNPHIRITANDISSAQIALARKHLPESVRLIQGDMMDIHFQPEELDAVVGMYSISHLPREEQTTMLQRIMQWLKPGGRLLMNFAERESAAHTDETWLGGSEGGMYWSAWGAEGTRGVLKQLGYEIEIDEVVQDDERGKLVGFLWIVAKKPCP
ncbi:hypothetical protein FE257_011163 [Aspergillus nanangensis]|uniref:Methyltransferase domain-containing protein n=1 Tax=Aspergillus nanangensis TaxID=2582783 RepID=A0AAD4CHW9_ASPNN|nr:hypothetical protein FE257_011163 [Aspergillus nanangensis]